MEANAQAKAPTERAELAHRVLVLISNPRSTARQIARLVDSLPVLRGAVIGTARDHMRGRGTVRTSAQAIVMIGFKHLSKLVAVFLKALNRELSQLTSGPHRLTQPVELGGKSALIST